MLNPWFYTLFPVLLLFLGTIASVISRKTVALYQSLKNKPITYSNGILFNPQKPGEMLTQKTVSVRILLLLVLFEVITLFVMYMATFDNSNVGSEIVFGLIFFFFTQYIIDLLTQYQTVKSFTNKEAYTGNVTINLPATNMIKTYEYVAFGAFYFVLFVATMQPFFLGGILTNVAFFLQRKSISRKLNQQKTASHPDKSKVQ